MKKRLFSMFLAAATAAVTLTGCGASETSSTSSTNQEPADNGSSKSTSSEGGTIGVSMPTKDLQRWNQDGSNMKDKLTAAGYSVDLQYASNDINTQVSQIENMINQGCKTLVIAAIDGKSLGTVLAQAKEKSIPVIAYDRLIMNTDAVSYYATFDNYKVGQKQGEYIEKELNLKTEKGPFNIEITAGDPGDNNAKFFYDGAMDILKPYIESGSLVVKSGQVEFEKVATAQWATDAAQSRMDAIIAAHYADGTKIDACLCSNDSTALGVANSLSANYKGDWPIITGQDCDIANVKNMIAGKQSMSVFKDTRSLAEQVVKMVDALMKGEEAPINDTSTYDNGTKVVDSYLCEPVFADINNYKELLIDSGYYQESDLK